MNKWDDPEFRRRYGRDWLRTHKGRYSTPEHLARKRARTRAYYRANKVKVKTYVRQWRKKNPEKWLMYQRKCAYGITEEQQRKLFAGLCALCEKRKPVHVDHDHKTKKVRGALCRACNFGLGLFQDDVKLLRKAIQYLKLHR